MNFWEWLSTPAGVEFTHAVIGLLIAVTGFIAYKTHQNFSATNDLIARHLRDHEVEQAMYEAHLEHHEEHPS